MASARKGPFSVPDPDDAEHTKAELWQRRYNAAQAAEDDRKDRAARNIKDTADLAGDEFTAAQLVPAVLSTIAGDKHDLGAFKAIKRVGGPLGASLSLGAASAGYEADRRRGMSPDEAFIKNYGGFALGTGLGVVGEASGTVVGSWRGPGAAAATGTIMGYVGQKDGEMIAEGAADTWRGLKRQFGDVARTANQGIYAINHPEFALTRRDRY